jgi:hypothetical protein
MTAASLLGAALFAIPASCGGQSTGGPGTGDGGTPDVCQGSACDTPDVGDCLCRPPAPGAPSYLCADGTTGGPVCNGHPDGTCDWTIRTCTPACPGLGCAPACPAGVLKDRNGCDTCTCAPVVDGGAGSSCTSNADCSGTNICGFPVADACAAKGTCFAAEQLGCNAASPGCACDGSVVNIICNGLPSGYAPAPLLHAGMCSDAAASGTCPLGTSLCGPPGCAFCLSNQSGAQCPTTCPDGGI